MKVSTIYRRRRTVRSAVVLLLAGLSILGALLFAGVLSAATSEITIAPTTGPVGTVVTTSGSGFEPNESPVQVFFETSTQVVATTTADGSGNWGPIAFTVPPSAAGDHLVGAFGSTTTVASLPGAKTFTVDAAISIDPTSGPLGTEVTVTGASFAANETPVQVTFDGTPVGATTTADGSGGWTASFTVGTPGGPHAVNARGPQTLGVADQTFTVEATIKLDPDTGPVGSTVTVNGAGFGAVGENRADEEEGGYGCECESDVPRSRGPHS